MKYLKYILAIIALLALLFIGRGMLTPSFSYSSEITIDKPVKETWAVMNDESKVKQWLKDITNIEHVSGEKNAVGKVTRYTFSENGQESVLLETIKAVRPDEHIAMDFVMDGVMNMDYKMDMIEQDGKTLLKSATVVKGEGLLMRSMLAFMQGSMQSQEDVNMNNLKEVVEANTTDYFPAMAED